VPQELIGRRATRDHAYAAVPLAGLGLGAALALVQNGFSSRPPSLPVATCMHPHLREKCLG
jgi:hypothetical protein